MIFDMFYLQTKVLNPFSPFETKDSDSYLVCDIPETNVMYDGYYPA